MPVHAAKPLNICKLLRTGAYPNVRKSGKLCDKKLAADVKSFKGNSLISQAIKLPNVLRVSPLSSLYLFAGAFMTNASMAESPSNPLFGLSLGAIGLSALLGGKYLVDVHVGAYVRASNYLKANGYNADFARPYFLTACGRNIIHLAAKENGCLQQYKEQYRAENIKWYHGFIPKIHKTKKPPEFLGYL